jgi:methionyl-tRNA formyltransferase
MALRVVFMGTPDFSVPTLSKLAAAGHDIVAVYTQPPRPAGRGMAEQPSPVHEKARELDMPIVMPKTLRIAAAEKLFASHQADVAVVVAYGLILPKPILEAPRHGCLNLHASALPRWRGAAPIQRALMAGDRETAVMAMRMEEGLDTGPVCLAERVPIGADETAGELHDRLAALGADVMARALHAVEAGTLECTPQIESGVTYAKKIEKAETRIDWARSAASVHNHIRGLSPFPGAWFEIPSGKRTERVKALRSCLAAGSGVAGTVLSVEPLVVACGEGAVELAELQRAGRQPVDAAAFARGARLEPGSMLAGSASG